jgi:hypothetical protein
VGEHVVQLPGDPAPLFQCRSRRLRLAGVLKLSEQKLAPSLALPGLLDKPSDQKQQGADQRRGHDCRHAVPCNRNR